MHLKHFFRGNFRDQEFMPVKNKLKISLKRSGKGYQNKPKKQKEKINKNKKDLL